MRRMSNGIVRRLMLIFALATMGWGAPALAQRTAITTTEALYPRVVRLSHNATPANNGRIVASVTAFPGGTPEATIYASDDGGTSFARIGAVTDPLFSRGLCCGGLYELPQAVGAMPAGTLLWAGSVGLDTPANPMQIRIYRSNDRGATWSYLSNCATGTIPRGTQDGLWEPEFTIAGDGSLVCFYADETNAGYSQLIQRVTSTDGITWSAPVPVVASSVFGDRPGMPVVSKLPSGSYFMSFEVCGPPACTAFYKTSPDGLNWGAATNTGTRIESEDGRWFLHTPTNAWGPVPGTPNGRIFVNGQILSGTAGIGSGNGHTIFYNDSADGSGKWKVLEAPVPISSPPTASNVCQNYSSPLLVSADGTSLLGLATDRDNSSGSTICRLYVGKTPTALAPNVTLAGTSPSFAVGQSGTSTITITPTNGYTGTMNLTVSIPNFTGTTSFDRTAVTFSSAAAQTATLTIRSTQTASLGGSGGSGGMPAMALLGTASLMFAFSALRKAAGLLAITAFLALTGCSGGGSSSGGGGGSVVTPPVPTVYTATITATDSVNSAIKSETQIQVTVNR